MSVMFLWLSTVSSVTFTWCKVTAHNTWCVTNNIRWFSLNCWMQWLLTPHVWILYLLLSASGLGEKIVSWYHLSHIRMECVKCTRICLISEKMRMCELHGGMNCAVDMIYHYLMVQSLRCTFIYGKTQVHILAQWLTVMIEMSMVFISHSRLISI